MTLGVALDAAVVGRYSGVGDKVYRNAKAALQKILGVTSKASARDLCIQVCSHVCVCVVVWGRLGRHCWWVATADAGRTGRGGALARLVHPRQYVLAPIYKRCCLLARIPSHPAMQFGCARHDQSVRAALAAYKERFVRSLPAVQQGHVDFGRPVFLAAAFYMVARKNKVAVSWRCLHSGGACGGGAA
jgi:hypothetical protein